MKKSNTAAIASSPRPFGASGSTYESRSVRKIDNGYVVNETCEKNGDYKSREYYCQDDPGMSEKPEGASSSMSQAVKSLKEY